MRTLAFAVAGVLVMTLAACGGGNQTPVSSPPPPSSSTPPPAAQAPGVPTGLAAVAGDTRVSLSWNPVSTATGYKVYQGASVVGSPTSASLSLTGLVNGTAYAYQVSAVNSAGESAKSAAISTTPLATPAGCSFPTLPAGDCNPWLPQAASGKTWQLSFSEEFNGTDYDHTKLTPCFDWNYGDCTSSFNTGREHYAPSQVRVSGGTAKLVAEPASSPIASSGCLNGQCTYLSGLLSTARPRADTGADYLYKFTYGYVEARLKLPATQGFFTAFWMLPVNTSYVYRSEIDILENLGYDSVTMFETYHYNDRSQSYAVNSGVGNNGACPAIDYSNGFHRFGLDWQADHVAWYIDGIKCGQFNGDSSTIESGPMQIILDLMVDHSWERSWNKGLLDPTLTRQLEVDYLRVFQQH